MITAYKITRCAHLDTISLEQAMVRNGYKDAKFKSNKFLGITNAGQFCYEVLYFDEQYGEDGYTKVFVDLDTNDQPVGEW